MRSRTALPFALVAASLAACGHRSVPPAQPVSPVEADYQRECRTIAAETQRTCPLILWATSIEDVEGGVVLHLGPEAPAPAQTEARARCHRAWMARYGREMPGPLSTSGTITITAAAGAQGTDVTIRAPDPAHVAEVRSRTHESWAAHRGHP